MTRATKASGWQSIDTAPKDGSDILAFCSDDCGDETCCMSETFSGGGGSDMCLYHGHAEGMMIAGGGLRVVQWGGAWDDRTYEYPNAGAMPDWWFSSGSDFECSANPVLWIPLPSLPPAKNAGVKR